MLKTFNLLILLLGYSYAQSCGDNPFLLTDDVNIISSPGYDELSYPSSSLCLWHLVAEDDKYLKISFLDIDLPKDNACLEDRLEISVGLPLPQRFCGNLLPKEPIILPASAAPVITFYSTRKPSSHRGFKLEIILLSKKPSCGKEFECRYQGKCVPNEYKCDGKSDCIDGSDEESCSYKIKELGSCGIPSEQPYMDNGLDRIVGGREAKEYSWPWQVSIQANYIFPSGHVCGGTLLNRLYAVTAAHCVVRRDSKIFRVKLGDHNLFTNEGKEVIRYVDQIIINKDYSHQHGTNDIALLKLSSPVDVTDNILPICLPELEELEDGHETFATGWGETGVDGTSDVLRQVIIPITNWERCRDFYLPRRDVGENSICTGYIEGGHNTCYGDSGGPLMIHKDLVWYLVGITSFGPRICGEPEQPAVYAKVTAFLPWIKETILQEDNFE